MRCYHIFIVDKNKHFSAFCPKCFERYSKINGDAVFTCHKCKSQLKPIRIIDGNYFLLKVESPASTPKVLVKPLKKIDGLHLDSINFPNKNDLDIRDDDEKVLDRLLSSKDYKKVLDYIDTIREDKRDGYDAPLLYYYEMLAKAKKPDYDSFVQEHGYEKEDLALIKKAINMASNNTGADLLVNLYNADFFHPTCYEFLELTLPYVINKGVFSLKKRNELLNNAFVSAIKARDKKTFDLLVSALNEDDVETYLHWLLLFANEFEYTDKKLTTKVIDNYASDPDSLLKIINQLIEKNRDFELINRSVNLYLSNKKPDTASIITTLINFPKYDEESVSLLLRLLPYAHNRLFINSSSKLFKYSDGLLNKGLYQQAIVLLSNCIPHLKSDKKVASVWLQIAKADSLLHKKGGKANIETSPYYDIYNLYNAPKFLEETSEDENEDSDSESEQDIEEPNNQEQPVQPIKPIYTTEFPKETGFRKFCRGIQKFGIGKFLAIVIGATAVTAITIGIAVLVVNSNIKERERRERHALSHFVIRATEKKVETDEAITLNFTFTNNSVEDVEWAIGVIHVSKVDEENFYEQDASIKKQGIIEHGTTDTAFCRFTYEVKSAYREFLGADFNDLKIVFTCKEIKFAPDSSGETYSTNNDFVVKDFNANE